MGQGYRVFTRPFELNIIGIRSQNLVPNTFNDRITVVYKDDVGQWQFQSFPATTDPGTFWLKNPLNPQGTAVLKAGQYLNSHVIGLHRSKYLALVQRSPVTVIREVKRDGTFDFSGKEDTGLTFMALCEQHKQRYGNTFSYTLLHETPALSLRA